MPKKRKFIDRKNAVTFHLVHRSQQDPLIADENAPQRVLVPEKTKLVKHIEEEHKYGIYYDDDYNYLQHLRETSTAMEWEQVVYKPKADTKLNLPSSVFASNVEEDVGLLNKAAPQSGLRLDLDPDIVAAMDEDFDFSNPENELEDNFVEIANAECSDRENDCKDDSDDECSSDFGSEERDEICSLEGPQYSFKEEETKSRFTDYSISSSVIRRNEQLTLLDDRFEKLYAAYDDNEIGALDCEEIEGHVSENSEILIKYAEEFEKDNAKKNLGDVKEKIGSQEYTDSESDEDLVEMEVHEKEKWDCESILSTYSNIYNHPKLIEEPPKSKIKINMKTGMPINVLNSNKLTTKALQNWDRENSSVQNGGPKSTCAQSIISTLSALSNRPKDESSEEKKERKRLLKEYRRERRLEKKANTLAFKEEAKRQAKIITNNRNNVQGNKIM